jgi:hypothetical protein
MISGSEPKSYFHSFTPWGWSIVDQIYMLPFLPSKNHIAGSEEEGLYKRIKILVFILVGLYLALLSPAILV